MGKEGLITLYHSTDQIGFEMARATGRLFGVQHLHPPDGYSGGSNLTPDKNVAEAFIKWCRAGGQWSLHDGPPALFVLTFQIPEALIQGVGKTRYFDCDEYATTLTVGVDDLPDEYLENQHGCSKIHRLMREEARRRQIGGEIRFYE